MFKRIAALVLISVFFITGCIATVTPPSPTYMALPGAGKSSAQYMTDDQFCRNLATAQAGNPSQIVQDQQAWGAILGLIGGGLFGLAVGGSKPGAATAIGAGAGAATGAIVGTATGQFEAMTAQQKWDAIYLSCMYNLGHQIPTAGGYQQLQPAPSQPVAPPLPPPPPPRK